MQFQGKARKIQILPQKHKSTTMVKSQEWKINQWKPGVGGGKVDYKRVT